MSVSHEEIKKYYSNVTVKEQGEIATHTCACGPECMPTYIRKILADIPEEITARFYGCGSPLPAALEGCTVLDLGCGTGRDVYLASKLVGPTGKVIGVDMNADQLAVAEAHHAEMADKWGYDNVEFKQGYIEALDELGIDDGSVDVVISNCVINLSPDKKAVFDEIWRVLAYGGELYFSDIFADRRVPE
ncbi:MAG: methyltransferase domain-containing protein, partial [Coriobacteriales bacterium]|nr:methyltransferase domain-containing protein [Coriobacteriales bacterium]